MKREAKKIKSFRLSEELITSMKDAVSRDATLGTETDFVERAIVDLLATCRVEKTRQAMLG